MNRINILVIPAFEPGSPVLFEIWRCRVSARHDGNIDFDLLIDPRDPIGKLRFTGFFLTNNLVNLESTRIQLFYFLKNSK